MQTLHVELGERSYPIHIGAGLLGDRELLAASVPPTQTLLVTNETIAPLYLERLRASLPPIPTTTLILPDGEQHKTLATFGRIIDELIGHGFHRDASVIAFGGGVVGDVCGFAAACYQRGIAYLQLPTTLLAQVDSSVGGKTAVNHPRAKNMIGAFHQPAAVVIDTDVLDTLPARELAAGLAEVIKYGLILDRQFFDWLERHMDALLALDRDALAKAVHRSCELKAAIVAEDEREHGRRALLNLGHTFGHALESLGGYERWLHGEAVAIGIALAARTSQSLGWLDDTDCRRIETLLERARLPIRADDIDAGALLERMQLDKKAAASGLRLILLERIGAGVVRPSPPPDALRSVMAAWLAP